MAARRVGALTLVFLSFLFGPPGAIAQSAARADYSARDPGVDVLTRKFRPVVSPDVIALDASGMPLPGAAAMSPYAAEQIDALLRDKEARSGPQRKICSKLLYTARMLQGLAAAPDVPSLETGVDVDEDGRVLVDIAADVTPSFLMQLQAQGASVYGSYPAMRSVRALVPAVSLENIAGWSEVVSIRPKQEAMTARSFVARWRNDSLSRMGFALRSARVRDYLEATLLSGGRGGQVKNAELTGQGSKTSEGDLTHRAFDARMAFGVNGSGIRIGVLSDGASSLAASQALGDLPPDVTVLPGQIGGGDEGTAMMEIVHDLAPGAKLYFATAFNGIASFAQNIRDLRAAGCDIIIDDVFYFDENPFVDGQDGAVLFAEPMAG